jgi:hypothetical protein
MRGMVGEQIQRRAQHANINWMIEGGHLFQSDRGHHSNLMAASSVSSRGPVLVMS